MKSTAPPEPSDAPLMGSRRSVRAWLVGVSVVTLLVVLGLGWLQYRLIDRVSLAADRANNSLVWDFYKLELQLANIELALQALQRTPADHNLTQALRTQCDIFASQLQLLQTVNSGQVMRNHAVFSEAMIAASAFMEQADLALEAPSGLLDGSAVQALSQSSAQLRTPVHRVVLAAYVVENERSRAQFSEIRQFTFYYDLASVLLIAMSVCVGWLVFRNFSLKELRHQEQRDQLRANQALAEASATAKSKFLSAASHDLRQPAHALGLFLSQLMPLALEPRARQLVTGANAAAVDLQNMLNDLFDLSRLDAATLTVRHQPICLEELLEPIRSGYAQDAHAKGLRLRVCASPVWVRTDPVLLQRILRNLVSNALRYTVSGSVMVAARHSDVDGFVRIEVRDSGIGIAPADHEAIFHEFFQVSNAQRDRKNGLGLGLSIVRRCCRLLDAPLTLHSELGCGACFSLRLPVVRSQVNVESESNSMALVPNELGGLRILVIEDDTLGREALAQQLTAWGADVTAADGAEAALALYPDSPWPEVIVADYRMAGTHTGVDAIMRLRDLAGQTIVACVITGDTDPEVARCIKAAQLPVLQKPVRPAKLRALLRNLLRQQTP